MKVIALNSSPRGEGISKTGMLLDALVEGMREAGAEVETIHLRQKKINKCMGCYTCWTKSPGVCAHKDDMTGELFPKWQQQYRAAGDLSLLLRMKELFGRVD
ncbi:MAG: flavodoxin family protein [Syntrophobacteraceae bacterium]|jgi:multimeric flavodoxin WrbA